MRFSCNSSFPGIHAAKTPVKNVEKVADELTTLTYSFTSVKSLHENRTCVARLYFKSHLSPISLHQSGCFRAESYSQVFLAPFMEQCEVNLTLQQDHKQHVSLCDDTIVCFSESPLYLILPLCAI